MKRALLAAGCWFLAVSCASKQPPISGPPQWDVIPPGVTDLLCSRLQMDALATGPISAVRVTQPLVTMESVTALRATAPAGRAPRNGPRPQIINRALPIVFGSRCSWKPLDTFAPRPPDEMIIELSAPIVNPVIPTEAGMFARATLGGDHPQWYWISIVPVGNEWGARWVYVLAR